MKIGILQTGKSPEETVEKYGSYSDMFVNLFNAKKENFKFEVFSVCDGIFPKNHKQCDGWIVTGSNHSTYEGLSWIKDLSALIVEIVNTKIPLLGICFGHQIIAQALGGEVKKSKKGWGLGIDTYHLEKKTDYMKNLGDDITLNIMHQDQVTKLPKDAMTYAQSDFCAYAGFYINSNVLTMQGHPELLTDVNKNLIHIFEPTFGSQTLVESALAEVEANVSNIGSDDFANTVCNFFLNSKK